MREQILRIICFIAPSSQSNQMCSANKKLTRNKRISQQKPDAKADCLELSNTRHKIQLKLIHF